MYYERGTSLISTLVTILTALTIIHGAQQPIEPTPPHVEASAPGPTVTKAEFIPDLVAPPPPPKPKPKAPPEPTYETFVATAYVSDCRGCIGITKTGVDVRDTVKHDGRRVAATDPKVIPLKTKFNVYIDGELFGKFTAHDIGSGISGKELDILMMKKETAIEFGRRNVEVEILK